MYLFLYLRMNLAKWILYKRHSIIKVFFRIIIRTIQSPLEGFKAIPFFDGLITKNIFMLIILLIVLMFIIISLTAQSRLIPTIPQIEQNCFNHKRAFPIGTTGFLIITVIVLLMAMVPIPLVESDTALPLKELGIPKRETLEALRFIGEISNEDIRVEYYIRILCIYTKTEYQSVYRILQDTNSYPSFEMYVFNVLTCVLDNPEGGTIFRKWINIHLKM